MTTDDISKSMNSGNQVDMAILDFSKAFNKVSHERLSQKLKYYGIDGNTRTWINSFLTDRKQQVVVDNATSDIASVTSGVPQGTVLGPTLFLIYINDIADNITSNIRLFADDWVLYRTINSTSDNITYKRTSINLYTGQISGKWILMCKNVQPCTFHLLTGNKNMNTK